MKRMNDFLLKIRGALYSKAGSLLVLIITIVLAMWQLSSFTSLMKWDIMDIALPWRYYVSETIRSGHLPLWNPYIHVGFPQYIDPSTWYWPSWILAFLLGSKVFTVQLEFLLHVLFAGFGAYKYFRYLSSSNASSLIGAVCFALSGFFIGNAQHLGWIIGGAYLPWILYSISKLFDHFELKYAIGSAVILSLILSGVYPGIVIVISYTILGLGLYKFLAHLKRGTLPQRWLRVLIAFILLSIALSLVTLMGIYDLLQFVNRGKALEVDGGIANILIGSFTPTGLLTMIIPFGATANGTFWGVDLSLVNVFIGTIPIVFLIYGIVSWKHMNSTFKWSLLIGAFFYVSAMGYAFPLRTWMYHILPFMDLFRLPTLFRLFGLFWLLIAFLCVFKYVFDFKRELQLAKVYTLFLLISLSVLIYCLSVYNTDFKVLFDSGFLHLIEAATFEERVVVNLGVNVLIGILVLAGLFFKQGRLFLVVICCFEMIVATQLNGYFSVWDKRSPTLTEQQLSQMPNGFPIPDLSIPVSHYSDSTVEPIYYLWKNTCMYYKYITTDGCSPYSLNGFNQARDKGLVDTILRQPLFFCSNVVGGRITKIDDQAQIDIESFNPNEVKLVANLEQEQYLVFVQNYLPYWKGYIDGKEVNVEVVNEAFMGVKLPRSSSNVRLKFKPDHVIISFYISIFTFVLAMIYLVAQTLGRTRLS